MQNHNRKDTTKTKIQERFIISRKYLLNENLFLWHTMTSLTEKLPFRTTAVQLDQSKLHLNKSN